MSLSLEVKGTYKNNKTNTIGAYCPKNNRGFSTEEKQHMHDMYNRHFSMNMDKFKKITVKGYDDGHKLFEYVIPYKEFEYINAHWYIDEYLKLVEIKAGKYELNK